MKKFLTLLTAVFLFFTIFTILPLSVFADEIMVGLPAKGQIKGVDFTYEDICPFGSAAEKKVASTPYIVIKSEDMLIGLRVTIVTLKNGKKYYYLSIERVPHSFFKRVIGDYYEGMRGAGTSIIQLPFIYYKNK